MPDTGYAEIYYTNAGGVDRVKIIKSFDMLVRLKNEDIGNYKHRVSEHVKALSPEIALNTIIELKWKGHSHYRHGY